MSTGAAEMVAYCGMEEHTHSEACYCAVQAEGEAAAETLAAAVPTGETAAETTEETTAPTEGAALSVSGGSDAQALIGEYVEKELCCGMEEHKHDIACYSNPLADLETAAIWEATLPEKLSGDWGKDLAEVAKSQLGYAESAANYLVGADGETLMGYSRYGAWYSSYTQDEKQAYADWNVPFLFFCLYYAGVEDFPIEEDCADWTAALAAAELWREAAGEYIPEAGDLVFLDTDDDGAADRAAVVTDWDEAKVTAVESDSEGAVKTVTYDLTEDTQVLGYGDTNEAQAQIEVSGGEDAPQLMSNTTFTIYFAGLQDWSGYAVHAYVLRGEGSNWQDVEMTKLSDTYTKDGTTYNVYKADVTEIYGGFDVVRFYKGPVSDTTDYYTANSTWVTKETIEGKIYVPEKGWYDDYSSGSGGGGGNTYTGPLKVGDTIYLDIGTWSGNSSGKFRVEIDGAKYELTHVSGNIYSVKIPNEASLSKSWIFRRDDPNNWDNNWNSVSTNLPTDGKNCFKVTAWDNEGTWSTYGGGTVTGTVVDIKSEAFSPAADTYYVNASFYDYYSDYEIDTGNRDNNTTGFVKGDHWLTFKKFNGALSSYYSNNNVKIPLYVGHFQPDWGDWGWKYVNMKGSENLYGYKQSGVYGTSNAEEKWFMSVNNSNMNIEPSLGHTCEAAQGLVSDTLNNGNLRSVKTDNQTTVAMPLFDETFLLNTKSNNKAIADVYHNVSFPFTKEYIDDNGVEYWVFDSEDTTLEMKQDSATGDYFLENVGYQSWSKNLNADGGQTGAYGFFPFNSGANSGNANTYNYGFGCRLDIPFRLTEDGMVDSDNGRIPIEFEFSGDDDVWVFIDGKLVLDIGGDHGKVTGTINFAGVDGVAKHMDVSATKSNPGNKTNTEKTTFTLSGKNTDDHVLTMFYMERGMWESNMRVTFNFPDENQLEVEKEVDMGNVNDIFKDSFKNQKLFTFNIKNLATHFADVNAKGATYNAIPWDVAGSTLTKDPSNTFSRDTYHDRSNALRWFAQYDDGSSQYRHKRYGVLSLPDTIDITNMAKLSFDVFVEGVSSFSLSNMYLQILDADVAISDLVDSALTAGNNNAMGCISSSLSGKTYGTPSTQGGTWVTITLDLSKLDEADGFDKTRVMHLRFGYNYPNNIYLSNITFLPAAQQKNPTGFITQQYDVPSYGSATSGELEPAAGAVYTSSVNTNARASYVVDGNGNFALQHGETVNFHDQFRRGSYIYLEEVLNAQERVLYSTKWSMYENDVAVSSKEDGNTINIVSNNGMIDVGTKFVSDGRTELVTNGTTAGHAEKNAYDEADRPANSFVFRSYANPDSTATTTKLKVKFTNTVNVGSLTITKKKVEGTTNLSGSFGFRVRFYNVGGIGLESEDIVLTFSLGQDESKTITGIPLNTQYSIYEIKPTESSHITLDHVTRADSTTSNPAGYVDTTYTTVSGSSSYTSKAYRVDGTISASDEYSVIFYNIYKPVVSLALRKLWRDGQNNDIANPPASITVQLQRSKNGTTWYSVTDRNIEPGYVGWKNLVYTFEDLDKYVDYPNDQTVWQYRVLEKNGANVVAHNTSITIDGVEFVVTYSSENGAAAQDQNGNWSQTITNTQDSNVSLVVKKNWTYANGTTPVTDYTQVPTAVYIQLYKQVGTEKEQYVGDYTLNPSADGKTWADYSLTISDLPKTDANGNVYKYFVREKKAQNQGPVAEGGTFTDNKGNEFTVSYSDVTEVDDKTFEQTITNKYSPKTEVTVTKKWTADNAGTTYTGKDIIPSSIWVGLQRKVADTVWSDNVEVLQKMQLTSTGNWTGKFENLDAVTDAGQAYEYRVVELTGENGTVVTSGNPIEYDGTTFKVTYSTTTDSETGAFTTTITNQVKYTASIAITKQASDTKQNLSGVTFKLEKWDSTYTTKDPNFDAQTDTTDGNGAASFSDLKSGCYLLTETQTKAGYNLLASPIKVEVKDTAEGKLEVYVNGTKQNIDPKNGVYTYSTTIYNKPKLDMPATGGVGGFEFWILGGLLIMAVPLLMYTFIWYRKGGKYLQR